MSQQLATPAAEINVDLAAPASAALSNMMSFLLYGKQPSIVPAYTPVCTHYMFEGLDLEGDE